ncbi:hypothetical protein L345_12786, partial [Ophiophagus hannah]
MVLSEWQVHTAPFPQTAGTSLGGGGWGPLPYKVTLDSSVLGYQQKRIVVAQGWAVGSLGCSLSLAVFLQMLPDPASNNASKHTLGQRGRGRSQSFDILSLDHKVSLLQSSWLNQIGAGGLRLGKEMTSFLPEDCHLQTFQGSDGGKRGSERVAGMPACSSICASSWHLHARVELHLCKCLPLAHKWSCLPLGQPRGLPAAWAAQFRTGPVPGHGPEDGDPCSNTRIEADGTEASLARQQRPCPQTDNQAIQCLACSAPHLTRQASRPCVRLTVPNCKSESFSQFKRPKGAHETNVLTSGNSTQRTQDDCSQPQRRNCQTPKCEHLALLQIQISRHWGVGRGASIGRIAFFMVQDKEEIPSVPLDASQSDLSKTRLFLGIYGLPPREFFSRVMLAVEFWELKFTHLEMSKVGKDCPRATGPVDRWIFQMTQEKGSEPLSWACQDPHPGNGGLHVPEDHKPESPSPPLPFQTLPQLIPQPACFKTGASQTWPLKACGLHQPVMMAGEFLGVEVHKSHKWLSLEALVLEPEQAPELPKGESLPLFGGTFVSTIVSLILLLEGETKVDSSTLNRGETVLTNPLLPLTRVEVLLGGKNPQKSKQKGCAPCPNNSHSPTLYTRVKLRGPKFTLSPARSYTIVHYRDEQWNNYRVKPSLLSITNRLQHQGKCAACAPFVIGLSPPWHVLGKKHHKDLRLNTQDVRTLAKVLA